MANIVVTAFLCNAVMITGMRLNNQQNPSKCVFNGERNKQVSMHAARYKESMKLEMKSDIIAELQKLPPITKKIHVTFPYAEVVNSTTDMVKYGLKQLFDFNPDWEHKVWLDADVDAYLRDHLAVKDWELISKAGYAEKSDLWRMLLLFCEGGYYQDVDRLYNIPLSKVLEPETKMLLPLNGADISQDLMCTAAGNPIFQKAIELNLARRREVHDKAEPGLVIWMGPDAYWTAATQALFGVNADRGDKAFLDAIHNTIISRSDALIKTKKESWCHLIVSEHPNCESISSADLNREFHLTHWTEKERQPDKK
jgi:hypothetical protein